MADLAGGHGLVYTMCPGHFVVFDAVAAEDGSVWAETVTIDLVCEGQSQGDADEETPKID